MLIALQALQNFKWLSANDKDSRYPVKRAVLYEKSCDEELQKMQAKLAQVEEKEVADEQKRKQIVAAAIAKTQEVKRVVVYVEHCNDEDDDNNNNHHQQQQQQPPPTNRECSEDYTAY
jgi:hypothetical protein